MRSFFRLLGRLRLWQQFVLLGLFVILVPIISTTSRFLNDGRRILTEHEIIDLSDESNLRANEIREEFAAVSRDVARDARQLAATVKSEPLTLHPGETREALARLAVEWDTSVPTAGARPADVGQVRRRYMGGALIRVGALTLNPNQVIAAVGPDGTPVAPDPNLVPILADLAQRAGRPIPDYVTELHLIAGRCVVAVGWPVRWDQRKPVEMIAVVIDFSRYIANRARTSPRHRYFLTRPDGTLLVHPNPELPARGAKIQDAVPWAFPDHVFPPANETPTDRNARLARMLREGGARLAGVKSADMQAYYRKGLFDGPLGERLGENAREHLRTLNQMLAAAAQRDSQFRHAEPNPTSSYIEIAHPKLDRVQAMSKDIEAWWRDARGKSAPKMDWIDPVFCETFQGQLTHLQLDEDDTDEPPRLIVAAALEELHEDIDSRFERIVWTWVLPTVGIAVLLTIVLVVAITASVRRLASAAEQLTDPNAEVELPGGGCREVSLLAASLRAMTTRLRDDAARYQTILRAVGEGIVVAKGEGVIEEANRAAARMFGYAKPEDMIGQTVSHLIEGEMPSAEGTPTLGTQAPFNDAVRGLRRDGSSFWLQVTLRPVALRDRHVVTFVFRDVTSRKAAEEQILHLNEDLERRVGVRTAELAEANTKLEVAFRQAEAAGRAKDAFVANMSHELRQPLHIIIGFTEALKEEAADAERHDLVPDLNKILSAAKHLLDLINDILDLAKISAGRMELSVTRFDLAGLVRDVKTLVAPLAEKNGNTFVVDTPPALGAMNADERRVRQILINLLSNAFKFTQQGKVTFRVRPVTETGREWIEFAVIDTGKGMTPDQVGRLFQRFYQADPSTTREQGGTGLGLAITQSFNDLMGGRPIQVTSVPGRGSEFIVRLPADVTIPAPHDSGRLTLPATPETGGTATPKPMAGTILIIDDDTAVHELMGRFLGREGFQVVTASNGSDGLRLAKELRPAVITLDVMMPGVDGWAVLAQLKADPTTCDIPVVMLTIVDDHGRGYALGAADYLTKPIDWQRLAAILRRYHPPGRAAPVLVIDDDPNSREAVRRHLERDGWRVTEAADGEAGLRAFAAESPALILLDLMMPGVDGFGFLDEFPKRFPGARTPVIVLTAKDLTADDFARLNGRVAKILEKGNLTNPDDLVGLIRRTAKAQPEDRAS